MSTFNKNADAAHAFDDIDGGMHAAPTPDPIDGHGALELPAAGSDELLSSPHDHGADAAPAFEPQADAGTPLADRSVGGSSIPVFLNIDGDGDLDLFVGHSEGGLKRLLSTSPTTALVVAPQAGTANPVDGLSMRFSSAANFGGFDGAGSTDTAAGGFDGVASYRLNVSAAAAPGFAAVPGTANPFNGIDVGTFSAPSLGDIDGDGDLDLVLGEQNGALLYYRNNGTAIAPAFAARTGAANPFNGFVLGFYSTPSLGDIDGDGDLDVVVGENSGNLRFYRNNGTAIAPAFASQNGATNPFTGFEVGSFSNPSLGDIDGDGDLDLVVGEQNGTLLYFRNNGTAMAPAYAAQTGAANPFNGFDVGSFSAPSLGDIDGDGDLDLVVGERSGNLLYYRNTGSATAPVYAQQTGAANPFNGFVVGTVSAPSLGDIDSDGDTDLVVGLSDGTVQTFQNQATPTTPVYAAVTGAANPFNGVGGALLHSTPSLGDIDGDGDLDLVVGESVGTFRHFLNTGTATAPTYTQQTGAVNPFNAFQVGFLSGPILGDIDGDGSIDLVVGDITGTLRYYRNTGTTNAPAYAERTGAANPFNGIGVGNYSKPSLGDIDGDGDLDLVVGEDDGSLNYYRNTGSATVAAYAQQTGAANPFDGFNVGFRSTPSLGDIDGDGDLDLVVGEDDGFLNYYRNTGTANAPAYALQTGTANPFNGIDVGRASSPSLGDIDRDGDLDLVVGSFDAAVLTFINNDAPTLSQAAITLTGTNEDTASPTQTVAALLAAAGRTDVDAGALRGLAVTVTTGLGQWQYSVGGAVWTPFGAVSATAALLLADGTSVRYVPDARNGETATLSFRAWDQSSGTASADNSTRTADTTTNGGATAFSSAGSTASLAVTSVNDAPTMSAVTFGLGSITEDTSSDSMRVGSVSPLGGGGWNDVDGIDSSIGSLAVTGTTGAGQWSYSTDRVVWVPFSGLVSETSALLLDTQTFLRYVPDGKNGELAFISARAWDQTAGVASFSTSATFADTTINGGTTAFSSVIGTARVRVESVNDAPTVSNFSFQLPDTDEDTTPAGESVQSLLASASAADVDSGALQGLAVTATAGNGQWQYSINGSTWTPVGAASTTAAVLLGAGTQLRYAPDRVNGETATLSFRAWDQSSGTASADNSTRTADTSTNGGATAFSTASSTASLLVTPVNDPPVAVNDTFTTNEDTVLTGNVLAANPNTADSDPDGGVLTVIAINGSSANVGVAIPDPLGRGTILLQADGTLTVDPRGAYDSFTSSGRGLFTISYTVSDGQGGTSVGNIDITVLGANDAPTTTPVTLAPIDENSAALTITQAMLLRNARDLDFGAVLTATGLTKTGGNGTLSDLGGGQWSYLPAANDDTEVSFSYTVSDGTATVAGSATLDILPVNVPPFTATVALQPIQEDSAGMTITQALLLANAIDMDLPAQALTASDLQLIGNGTLTPLGGGSWSYQPALNDDTEVSFIYTVSDGTDTVAGSATLDITPVNDAPTTAPVTLLPAMLEDSGTRTITQAQLLANAADVDLPAQALSVSNLQLTGNGTLDNNNNGTWTFTPALNDDTGVSFSYTISDGTDTVGGSATLDITPVNDAPTLAQSAISLPGTDEDTTSTATTVQALLASAGWADVDAGALQGMAVTGTTGAGQWYYSTNSTAWVPFSVSALLPFGLLLGATTVVRYQPDGENGETPTLSFRAWDHTTGAASSNTSLNSVNITSSGGSTAFSSATSTASLVVASVNDAPSLTNTLFLLPQTDENTATAGVTVESLLASANAADVDAGALQGLAVTVTFGGGQWQYSTTGATWTPLGTPTAAASVLLAAGTSLRYVPDGNNSEITTLGFRVWDQTSGSASTDGSPSTANTSINGGTTAFSPVVTANLLVTAVNDTPVTTPVTLDAIQEDSSGLLITQALLLANATDVDRPAQTLTASNLQLAGNGTLTNLGGGNWNFRPAPNDDTDVSFSYTISDGTDTVAGSATLDITPVNDAPRAFNDSAQTAPNTGVDIAVTANDTDADGDRLRVTSTSPSSNGTVVISADGAGVRYTPNTGFSGFDSFTYAVSDPSGVIATAGVRVLVAGITGSNGNDTTLGSQQADFVLALDGNDRILTHDGADYVDGGRGADTITGGAGADTLLGGDGPDTFLATSGELAGDQIDGGDGTDTLVITNAPASLPANFSFTNLEQISYTGGLLVEHTSLLDLSSLTLASGSSNNITGGTANSRITGTASADNIADSAGNDDLRGAGGNDTITGGFGQDTLHGGTGNDVLYGGTATAPNDFVRDLFVFNTPLNASTNVDQIIGFQAHNQDRIQLDSSIFAAITGGTTTGLDADEFRSINGGNALDGNDFILFDPATGNLFYDADGNGPGAKVLFATLVGLTGTLDAADFVGPAP